jgi:hypothetical protein
MLNKPTVFIHTNNQQIVGALLGAYSMKRASKHPDAFDVRLIRLEDTPHLLKREGKSYVRKGRAAIWHNEDLQSFSPLRRMVPQLMGFNGRAVVTDPDIFAVGDIYELLTCDMGGKSILCRNIVDGYKGAGKAFYASSVMLLDCAKLKHWRWDEDVDAMFSGKLDYGPWIGLTSENPETIGEIGEEWNSFDKLTPETKLLHTTERWTQPWKTGLPVDFDMNVAAAAAKAGKAQGIFDRLRSRLLGKASTAPGIDAKPMEHYLPHPDPNQERFIFDLLKDALEEGEIDEAFVQKRIDASDVRRDAFDVLRQLGYQGPPAGRNAGRLVQEYAL